nr:unnamed protein product [Digitaria exilis]
MAGTLDGCFLRLASSSGS